MFVPLRGATEVKTLAQTYAAAKEQVVEFTFFETQQANGDDPVFGSTFDSYDGLTRSGPD